MSGTGWFCPGCNKYHAPYVMTCPSAGNPKYPLPGVVPSTPATPYFPLSPYDPVYPYQPYTISSGTTIYCQKCGRYVTENCTCSIKNCGRVVKYMLNESQTGDDK